MALRRRVFASSLAPRVAIPLLGHAPALVRGQARGLRRVRRDARATSAWCALSRRVRGWGSPCCSCLVRVRFLSAAPRSSQQTTGPLLRAPAPRTGDMRGAPRAQRTTHAARAGGVRPCFVLWHLGLALPSSSRGSCPPCALRHALRSNTRGVLPLPRGTLLWNAPGSARAVRRRWHPRTARPPRLRRALRSAFERRLHWKVVVDCGCATMAAVALWQQQLLKAAVTTPGQNGAASSLGDSALGCNWTVVKG